MTHFPPRCTISPAFALALHPLFGLGRSEAPKIGCSLCIRTRKSTVLPVWALYYSDVRCFNLSPLRAIRSRLTQPRLQLCRMTCFRIGSLLQCPSFSVLVQLECVISDVCDMYKDHKVCGSLDRVVPSVFSKPGTAGAMPIFSRVRCGPWLVAAPFMRNPSSEHWQSRLWPSSLCVRNFVGGRASLSPI